MYNTERNFNKNFRIPRRTSDKAFGYETPLTNDDSNYQGYSVQRSWKQGATFTQYPTHYPPVQYPTPVSNPVEPITQNIWNTLNNIKERPKTYQRNKMKETIPDVDDESLPKDLVAMFQPLYCKLCSAQLSSNVMAKIHYKSKNHEKNVRKYLVEYSDKSGEPLHKRAKVSSTAKTEDEQQPRWFHCEVCDLPLTGKIHAESHYMGKNHRKALTGHRPPAGLGYYDNDGKWVRTAPTTKKTLKDGEDTFGEQFKKKPSTLATNEQLEVIDQSDVAEETPASDLATPTPGKYFCDLCKVGATCQEQLDMHFNGQKHKKKLKNRGMPMVNTNEELMKADEKSQDPLVIDSSLITYRTPSGEYYCSICNLTLNSDIPFRAHLLGKNHRKKLQKQEQ